MTPRRRTAAEIFTAGAASQPVVPVSPDPAPLNLEAAADFIAETAAIVEQQQRRPRPEKPVSVRFTLDLDQAQHRFLKAHAAGIDAKASEVMRALLGELQADPELAVRVRDRVWQSLVQRSGG